MTFREVTRGRWTDFERLFESRGGPKYCWCMAWRATPAEANLAGGRPRKAAIRRRVSAGIPIGILGYLGREPVAWCSIAPRRTYRRLVPDDSPDEGVWSIACFFVKRDLRGGGFMSGLIDAAVKQARKRGAAAVEAYPVDPDSPSYRFMGFVETFRKAGFRETGREGSRRHVMRLTLRGKNPGRAVGH